MYLQTVNISTSYINTYWCRHTHTHTQSSWDYAFLSWVWAQSGVLLRLHGYFIRLLWKWSWNFHEVTFHCVFTCSWCPHVCVVHSWKIMKWQLSVTWPPETGFNLYLTLYPPSKAVCQMRFVTGPRNTSLFTLDDMNTVIDSISMTSRRTTLV